jgi:hypothetical protein
MRNLRKRLEKILFFFIIYFVCYNGVLAKDLVSIVLENNLGETVQYGIEQIEQSLEEKGFYSDKTSSLDETKGSFVIVAGLSGSGGPASKMLENSNFELPISAEALVIRKTVWRGKTTIILCGADDGGLMYAALDVADRILWSDNPGNPFSDVSEIEENPDVVERAVSIYTMHRRHFESHFYNNDYWERYFDMLAKNRFNSFVIIFGYENGGFMAPLYPYFFNVDEFPNVELIGINPDQQEKNTATLKHIIKMAHNRGIKFSVGIWDHIYRGGVQGGGIPGASQAPAKPTNGLVWGVTSENLSSYNKTALKKFLQTFTELDGIQFRMHWESGLKREETRDFWKEIFSMCKTLRPEMRLDARAKGLPDKVIEDALTLGVDLRITTKYWMEQMGLPFHPTHINVNNQKDRRHGYADLLRYPKRYDIHWRMWTGGTTRILLWGDPEYVKTFAKSTHLYNGQGFEINGPLATKMLGQPHDQKPFSLLNKDYQYYDWEFERYWHYYQVFGRLSYNPDTSPEIWHYEFEKRFGEKSAPFIENGLHLASRVLPRIVASCYLYRYFPTTRGWAEKMRMGDLPEFATAEGSDIQLFANFEDAAKSIIDGTEMTKIHPRKNSMWFESVSKDILHKVSESEKYFQNPNNKEFISTTTDLRILAHLALYYSKRIPAAVNYNLFKFSGDLFALDKAIAFEKEAIVAWSHIVKAAGDVYSKDLKMGVRKKDLSGHWIDELYLLKEGLIKLENERDLISPPENENQFFISHIPIRKSSKGERLNIAATVESVNPVATVQVAIQKQNNPLQYFDLNAINSRQFKVDLFPIAENESISYFLEVQNNTGEKITFPKDGKENPIVVFSSADDTPPDVELLPVSVANPLKPLKIKVRANGPSDIKWVRLRYRHVTQFEDYKVLEMVSKGPHGVYAAEIPGDFIVPEWDIMYFVEVMDLAGNGKMFPDLEKEIPYVIVPLNR